MKTIYHFEIATLRVASKGLTFLARNRELLLGDVLRWSALAFLIGGMAGFLARVAL